MRSTAQSLPEECLPQERQNKIIERLSQDGRVLSLELSRQFGTSEDTIRRDLRELAAAGRCRRVYGGALPVPLPISPASAALRARYSDLPERKQALGAALAGLLPSGQVVFVDAGSTNLAAMRALPEDRTLTVVTNSPVIAAEVAWRDGIELVVIGGRVDRRSGGAFGARALRDIADLRPDVYLLGTCALDAVAGIGVFGYDEAEFKRALIAQSSRVVAAATSDKLGTRAPFGIGPAGVLADLVLEASALPEQADALMRLGISIHRAATTAGSAP